MWSLRTALYTVQPIGSVECFGRKPFIRVNLLWEECHISSISFRGFALVGPFVEMIYRMLKRDFLIFFIIYMIFVIGFSQGNYLS